MTNFESIGGPLSKNSVAFFQAKVFFPGLSFLKVTEVLTSSHYQSFFPAQRIIEIMRFPPIGTWRAFIRAVEAAKQAVTNEPLSPKNWKIVKAAAAELDSGSSWIFETKINKSVFYRLRKRCFVFWVEKRKPPSNGLIRSLVQKMNDRLALNNAPENNDQV